MWYKNIQQFDIKNRNVSLFEIYGDKNDMFESKNIVGYSVRFATHSVKRRRFLKYFNENERDYNNIDEEYGLHYWDFQYKNDAIKHIESLEH